MAAELAINGGPKVRTREWPPPPPRFGEPELQQLREALEQNTLFYAAGQKTRQMLEKMKSLCGAQYAVACSSGSAAIHGAIKACELTPGDEIITTPVTDAGTILGIVYEGAIPVFADIDPHSCNITAESIAAKITPATKAVIVVHLVGCPADMPAILEVCRRHKLLVIEDCAQAWGAKINGQWVGTFGDLGCFSLNDFKHISAGDGGIIITNNPQLEAVAKLAVDKCYDRTKAKMRNLEFLAPNYRITELQSAVAIAQLDRLEGITTARNRLGNRLGAGLAHIPGVHPLKVIPGAYPTYWFYLIHFDPEVLGVDGITMASALNAEGIPGGNGYAPPVYLSYKYLVNKTPLKNSLWPFSVAKNIPNYTEGSCPFAEAYAAKTFRFGLKEHMSDADIDDVIAAVRKVAGYYRGRKEAADAAKPQA